jgi:excinuclease ABC subunit A
MQAGNTVLIVEHDPEVIGVADHIIDLGPGPGASGGRVVFEGTFKGIFRSRRSATGAFLSGRSVHAYRSPFPEKDRPDSWLKIRGAREHNLKNIDVDIPVGRMVCITGVSGSGKSTLLEDVLFRYGERYYGRSTVLPGACDRIDGLRCVDSFDDLDKVIAPLKFPGLLKVYIDLSPLWLKNHDLLMVSQPTLNQLYFL